MRITHSIAEDLFRDQGSFIIIPGGYSSIDPYVFAGGYKEDGQTYWVSISEIFIPNSITSIGHHAFANNSLILVDIPDSITSIGGSAFRNNELTSVVIPESVDTIGSHAFYNNQLTSVDLPDNITSIAGSLFAVNKLTSVVIPDSVVSIGSNAFKDNKLTSVVIPSSVTSIGDNAFASNSISQVDIPEGITSIEPGVFADNKLTSVVIPDSVTSIGGFPEIAEWMPEFNEYGDVAYLDVVGAFARNELTSVVIPDSVTSIGTNAFKDNKLTSVVIPSSVASIGNNAFASNSLSQVDIPDSITSIEPGVFADNKLTSVVIPGRVASIGSYAFNRNRLTSVVIPDSVTSIGAYVFGNNALKSLSIPKNVDSIHEHAFSWVDDLETLSVSKYFDDSSLKFQGHDREGEWRPQIIRRDNEEPYDISLSGPDIVENIDLTVPIALINTTDEVGDVHSYDLVEGEGDDDNQYLEINRNRLFLNSQVDFENKSDYRFRLRTTDLEGLTFEKSFNLTVNDVNETPMDLAISTTSFDENISYGTVIATLGSSDVDAGDSHTYALVTGDGDADNSAFAIDGDRLKIVDSVDFENKSSYSIRLQTTDSGGLTFQKAFALSVNDINESPSDLTISLSNFDENIAGGSVVATLSTSDVDDGDIHVYTYDSPLVRTGVATTVSLSNWSGTNEPTETGVGYSDGEIYETTATTGSGTGLKVQVSVRGIEQKIYEVQSIVHRGHGYAVNDIVSVGGKRFEDGFLIEDGFLKVTDVDTIANSAFAIDGDHLKIIDSPDFESRSSYPIRLRSTDSGGLTVEKAFTLTVNDLREIDYDFNGDKSLNIEEDAVIGLRSMFGTFPGDALTNNALNSESSKSLIQVQQEMTGYFQDSTLDRDADGIISPFTDGIQLIEEMQAMIQDDPSQSVIA